jgi:uncharacterized protein (DUF1810 family)
MSSPINRFLDAQDDIYETALEEMRNGRKDTHWMWFVFPQIAGLGQSSLSKRYAIADLREAAEYLAHSVLGERLRECTEAVLLRPESIKQIFGTPDHLKFRSSMTLFAAASRQESIFHRALREKCNGVPDPATQHILHAKRSL